MKVIKVIIGIATVTLCIGIAYWIVLNIGRQSQSSAEKDAALGCLRSVVPEFEAREPRDPLNISSLIKLEQIIGRAPECRTYPFVCIPTAGTAEEWAAAIEVCTTNCGYWLSVGRVGVIHPVSFSTQGPPTGSIVIRNPSFASSRWEPPKQAR